MRAVAFTMLFTITLSTPAFADWEYTRWGMTPEQVAAASSGNVKVLPKPQRQVGTTDHSEIAATGTFKVNGHELAAGFQFDDTGLTCILYNGLDSDVGTIREMLINKYGPASPKAFPGGYSMGWNKPESVDLTVSEHPLTAAVVHCRAGAR